MAYSNSTGERMDELRFRSQQASRNDSPLLGLVSPPRNGTRLPPPTHTQDGRANLTRRFTTDSGRVPTLNSIASQRGPEENYAPSVCAPFLYSAALLHSQRTHDPLTYSIVFIVLLFAIQ